MFFSRARSRLVLLSLPAILLLTGFSASATPGFRMIGDCAVCGSGGRGQSLPHMKNNIASVLEVAANPALGSPELMAEAQRMIATNSANGRYRGRSILPFPQGPAPVQAAPSAARGMLLLETPLQAPQPAFVVPSFTESVFTEPVFNGTGPWLN